MKRIISLWFLMLSIVGIARLNAQELKFFITDFELDQLDMTAKEIARDDGDGSLYAIIKVTSDIEDDNLNDFKFDFGYMKSMTEVHDGELWVFVQRNAKNVTIRRDGYKTLQKYNLKQTIKAGCTYVMKLSVQQPKVVHRVLQFKVTPSGEGAIVKVKPEDSSEDYELWGTVDASGSIDRLLNTGVYLYEVSADNYITSQGRIQLVNGQDNHVENVSLTPNFGFLEVDNTYGIAGAEIYINNKKVGTIPYKSGRMECGEDYKIMISNGEMYKTYNSTFAIRRGETTKLSPRLESNFAETTIKVDGNAEIFVNGESKGRGSWTGPLRAGTYNVVCRLYRHTDTEKQITVKPDFAETFVMDNPTPIEGSIYVRSTPSGARILIDGKETSYVTPQNIPNILIGEHEVSIMLANHKAEMQTVMVKEGETTTVDVKLSDIAEMKISSNPSGATLYVDNESKGTTPYIADMASGEYLIRLEKKHYETFSKRVHLDSSHPEQTFKLNRQYMGKFQFYAQPMVQVGSYMSIGIAAGAYIHKFNVEADFLYGLSSTEEIYETTISSSSWTSYSQINSYEYHSKLSSWYFGGRVGYGLKVGTRIRITPQWGIGLLQVNGIPCYSVNSSIGARADWTLANHIGLVLAPEYSFPLQKSKTFNKVTDVLSKVNGWAGGFNVRLGVNIFF